MKYFYHVSFYFHTFLGICAPFSMKTKLTHMTTEALFTALSAHISYYILVTLMLLPLHAFIQSYQTDRL